MLGCGIDPAALTALLDAPTEKPLRLTLAITLAGLFMALAAVAVANPPDPSTPQQRAESLHRHSRQIRVRCPGVVHDRDPFRPLRYCAMSRSTICVALTRCPAASLSSIARRIRARCVSGSR